MNPILRPAESSRDGRRTSHGYSKGSVAIGLLALSLVIVMLPSCAGLSSSETETRQNASQERILEKLQRKTWSDPETVAEVARTEARKAESSSRIASASEEDTAVAVGTFDPFARPGSMPSSSETSPFEASRSIGAPDSLPSDASPESEVAVGEVKETEAPPLKKETDPVDERPSAVVETTPDPEGTSSTVETRPTEVVAAAIEDDSDPIEVEAAQADSEATIEVSAPEGASDPATAPTEVVASSSETPQNETPTPERASAVANAPIPDVGTLQAVEPAASGESPTSLLEALSSGVREALASKKTDASAGVEARPASDVGNGEPMAVPAARFTEGDEGLEDDATLTAASTESLSLELRDVPLKDLIRAIAQQNRMNVIVPETLTERVSISLDGVDPFDAMTSILKSNGYRLLPEGSLHRVEAIAEEEQRMESETFTLTSVPLASVQDSLENIVSENGKLIMNEDSPSFVMIDYPENLIAMADFLRLIDRREKQVLIEVQILEVILDENDAIGTSVEILDIDIDDTTLTYGHDLLPDSSFTTIGVLANQSPITATIEALSIRRKLNILSTPKIVTLNGREASIKVTSSIPYIDATATTSTTIEGGGATVVEQVEFTESGISLDVTPVIANDGYVKLKITPEVKELVDFFNGIPVIDSRRIDTNVLVQNGNTVILGGLLREEEMHETQKTPILGDIPLVGAAFRRKEKSISKSELLVFITPYILEGDAETRLNIDATDRLKQGKKAFTPRKFR